MTGVSWEASYDNDVERGKRTTRDLSAVPDVACLRAAVDAVPWEAFLGYGTTPDPTLHGGGLHVTAPGGYLGCHLDYDLHPKIPARRRALNVIAFLNPVWRPSWGGGLVLCDPLGAPVRRFYPRPGRVVAFEVSDLSYHGVEPVRGPAERVTLAVYRLAPAGPANTRRRALFFPNRSRP